MPRAAELPVSQGSGSSDIFHRGSRRARQTGRRESPEAEARGVRRELGGAADERARRRDPSRGARAPDGTLAHLASPSTPHLAVGKGVWRLRAVAKRALRLDAAGRHGHASARRRGRTLRVDLSGGATPPGSPAGAPRPDPRRFPPDPRAVNRSRPLARAAVVPKPPSTGRPVHAPSSHTGAHGAAQGRQPPQALPQREAPRRLLPAVQG